jgi:intracellular septation protein
MKKMLFDFFPILLFFIVFKFYPDWVAVDSQFCIPGLCFPGGNSGAIYAATLAAIVASVVQLAWSWSQTHKIENMHLITLVLLVVLGGATIIFQDEVFIKWKPTVVNWLFGAVFLGSQFIGKKPLVQRMMESAVKLTDERVWVRLNLLWVAFFVVVGFINIYVAYSFSLDFWVNFKLFGLMGLTILFVIAQAFYVARYIEEDSVKATEHSD